MSVSLQPDRYLALQRDLEQAEAERDEYKKGWDYYADIILQREKRIVELEAEVERLRSKYERLESAVRGMSNHQEAAK
jgi:chromosome segregation ATPase